jgi:hypothetical protein
MEDTLKKEVLTGQVSRSQTARLRRRRGDLQLSSLQQPGDILARAANHFPKPAAPRTAKEDILTLVK